MIINSVKTEVVGKTNGQLSSIALLLLEMFANMEPHEFN